jgi:DNA-binding transcriptional LysR family regulator
MADFREMSYALAIAKYQNITKAANALFITQPTLTKFLQNLEHEVGQDLFNRIGNKYVPTYAGERYLEKAKEILAIKKELDQEMGDIIKNNEGLLRIAFPVMRGSYMLPCTLPIFRSLYPNVKLAITEANSWELEDMILNNETDLAFFNLPVRKDNIDYDIISHEEVLLVMSEKNPLSEKGIKKKGLNYPWMDLRLLKNQGLILQVPGQRTRNTVDQLFKTAKMVPENILLETSNIRASVELTARNYGVCFVTETHLRHIDLAEKLRYFSVGNPNTTVDFAVAYRKGSYIPYHAREYIKIVRDFT